MKHSWQRKVLALSVDVVRTSGPLKRRGMVDSPVKNAVANPPEVTRFDN